VEEGGTVGEGRRLATGWQGLIAAAASAFLHTLAFPPFNLAEAAYLFALPLLLLAFFRERGRAEGWCVFVAGWISWISLLFWLRNVTGHLTVPFAGALGWFALLALSAIVAVFWWGWFACALYVVRLVKGRTFPARLGGMVGLAAGWVVMEWVRTVLFTGFPWLLLSVSQWERPLLLQILSITGGSGLSFILILFNLGLAFYLHNLWRNRRGRWWQRLSPEFYLALGCLFGGIAYGLSASGAGQGGRLEGPEMAFVQPDVGATEKWDAERVQENLRVLSELTRYGQYLGAELVLWPESPTPGAVKGNDYMRNWVEELSASTQLPFLIGNIAIEPDPQTGEQRLYNAVFSVSPASGIDLERYAAKRHLVPFGEYVPFAGAFPFLRKVVPVPGDFYPARSVRLVELDSVPRAFSRLGVLVCYEDIFPRLARENVLAGADWHYVATNNNWFGRGGAALQHAAHSILRAVETRRPVVRCGNAGWSGWIDAFGHVRHTMLDERGSVYFRGVESVAVSKNRYWHGRTSFYVRHGEWFTGMCGILLVFAIFLVRLSRPLDPNPATGAPRRPPLSGLRKRTRPPGESL